MKFSLAFFALVGSASAFTVSKPAFSAGQTALFSTVDAPVMSRTKTKAPVFDEVCETTGVTLTRFMTEVAMLNPELKELTTLFGGIDTACKAISNLVKRSQLPASETLGYEGNVNVQGEDQKVCESESCVVRDGTSVASHKRVRFCAEIGCHHQRPPEACSSLHRQAWSSCI